METVETTDHKDPCLNWKFQLLFISFLAVESVINLTVSETCQFSHFELWVAAVWSSFLLLSASVIFVFSPLGFSCSPFILLPSSLSKHTPSTSDIVGTHIVQVSLACWGKASHLLASVAFPQMRWHPWHRFASWTAFLHIHFCMHFPISVASGRRKHYQNSSRTQFWS